MKFIQIISARALILQRIELRESVQIWAFFCSIFCCIRNEYGDLHRKSVFSPNTENMYQKSSEFGHFPHSGEARWALVRNSFSCFFYSHSLKSIK